jgi:MFS family permease
LSAPSTGAQPQLSVPRLALTVLAPFALGYIMSYFYRSINAVVAPNLVADIGLTAGELGLLTSAYLAAFGLFQLPLGLLLDRYGPRRVQAGVFCVAAAGSLLFAVGESTLVLTIARAMIGLGFAGGLMSGFKAVVLWVPPERRALANGTIMSLGGFGLLAATVPTEIAVQWVGWRAVFVGLAGITIAVAALILLVVPEKKSDQAVEPVNRQLAGLMSVFGNRVFWRMTPLLATTAGSHIGIQTLWAGPWFRDVAGFDRDGVALHLGFVAIAFVIGIFGGGVVTDFFGRRGVSILTVMSWMLIAYMLSQGAIILEVSGWAFYPAWIVFGMTGQLAIVAFAWLAMFYGPALSGRATTATNLIIFLTAFAIQYAVGAIIDLYPVTADGGYDPQGYQTSFAIVLAIQVVAFLWYITKVPQLPPDAGTSG